MLYTVTITDETGRTVHVTQTELDVENNGQVIDEFAEQNDGRELSEGEQVLFHVAPELCPWDCDHCSS